MSIYLVVNYICVDEHEILVGATDSERWEWDRAAGMSGVVLQIYLQSLGKLKSKK